MGTTDQQIDPPSRDQYAELFVATLRSAGDEREVNYNAEEFRLEYAEGGGVTNFRNFYDEYCAVPKDERDNLLRQQVRGALSHLKEMPTDFEDAKCDILPKMWTRATLENMRLQQRLVGKDQLDIPTQLVGEHLEASLAYDLPEAVRTISQGDLDDWGITYYEAMEIARANLEATEVSFAQLGEHLYASLTGDTYDATRLMNLELIRKLEVDGDRIAMIPNRDTLLITGTSDVEGLTLMHKIAEDALANQPRPMLATPLRLDGDDWVDWMPAADHPLYEPFRALELNFLHQEYGEQKQLLEAIHERDEVDIFVASYTAMQRQDTGQLFSYCIWSEGVQALLPKAQNVLFGRNQSELPAIARWDHVMEVVGHRMEETDDYPVRYRVTDFPSDEELAALGKVEL